MPRIVSQMNSTSVLDFFPPKPTMALDIAMKFYLHSPTLKRDNLDCRIGPKPDKPLRPCIQPNDKLLTEINNQENKVKKRVSFADSRGLSLTMVKVYSEFDDPLEIPFNITELIDNIYHLTTLEKEHLVLDFAQPAADYLDFRNRLQTEYVCLENCMLKERSLVGTVKVKNLAFQKCVKIRMTCNSWRTFTDHECQYVKDTYAGSDRDTFSFDIVLPDDIHAQERIEFAVYFECSGKMYWDSNKGQNYRIIRSGFKSRHCESDYSVSLDQFGSPRCSYGIFPEWAGYSGFDKQGPYY
ncbi:protein phosphatase 1 regulatory subunit 3B [Hyla sarda]|uniref:protein phosphatase 1 regulatory subunit 3B n=1 Tax=Hyla sarda TaxID=327740 RepID=UPI0024C37FE2|nr:protein phosphatase 1 regulatory subunit 3B [Hyla sarda]XP_056425526.1 protein phosphatase 1 regulatory subunit 3B [Hyla sarda]XP_056425533.1 protein phosphatase 1 regulatory subunit 3B [Hyla sarda]